MSDSFQVLDDVEAGRISADEAAVTLGISPNDVSRQLEMLKFARAYSRTERRAARTRFIRTSLSVLAVVILTSTVWCVRVARAAGSCAQTLPSPLSTFCPNDPALAVDMNNNLQTLASSIILKTGSLTGNTVTTPAGATINGQLKVNSSTSMPIDFFGNAYGLGVQNSTSYFRTGGGFAWFLNGTHVGGNQNDPGAGGTTLATLDNGGTLRLNNLEATLVNGRRPGFTMTKSCTGGSCSVSCSPGVVKMAFGFHGSGAGADSGSWACPGGFQWLGTCLGQTNCGVSTACSSSGIFAECW